MDVELPPDPYLEEDLAAGRRAVQEQVAVRRRTDHRGEQAPLETPRAPARDLLSPFDCSFV